MTGVFPDLMPIIIILFIHTFLTPLILSFLIVKNLKLTTKNKIIMYLNIYLNLIALILLINKYYINRNS